MAKKQGSDFILWQPVGIRNKFRKFFSFLVSFILTATPFWMNSYYETADDFLTFDALMTCTYGLMLTSCRDVSSISSQLYYMLAIGVYVDRRQPRECI